MPEFKKSNPLHTLVYMLWLVTVGALVAQAAMAYGKLPDVFASHFDGAGNPNGWSSKNGFYAIWIFCLMISNVWPPILPWLMRVAPRSMLNIRNKDYWMATPERLSYMIAVIRTTLCLTMLGVNFLLFDAFRGTMAHALGGKFEFSLSIFFTVLIGIILFAILYPLIALRVPKEERACRTERTLQKLQPVGY